HRDLHSCHPRRSSDLTENGFARQGLADETRSWGTLAHHEAGAHSHTMRGEEKAGAHSHTMRGEETKKGGRRKERKKERKKGKGGEKRRKGFCMASSSMSKRSKET